MFWLFLLLKCLGILTGMGLLLGLVEPMTWQAHTLTLSGFGLAAWVVRRDLVNRIKTGL
jgi:hypothetical protein